VLKNPLVSEKVMIFDAKSIDFSNRENKYQLVLKFEK
jgi:hypothetical protein